ncbi:MAG: phosphohistidine phosphatase SixA [Synechococcaceae cyanobacterium]
MALASPLVLPEAELLLLRHGIAEPREQGRSDAARTLTAAGRRRCAAVLTRLRQRGLAADRLLSSPLVRARQTAELAVEADLAPCLELAEELAPDGDPLGQLASWLGVVPARSGRRPRLLLVGHEPDLGDLASALIGAPAGAITLRKSGLALLRCGGPAAVAASSCHPDRSDADSSVAEPDDADPETPNGKARPRPQRLASLRLLLTPSLLVGGAEA